MECLFCKIVAGDIPSVKIYEDEEIYAFKDIEPIAPHHVLIIPKKHISGLDSVNEDDIELLGKLQLKVSKIASQIGIAENGYRLISNCGEHGMQSVRHLHYHLLGGEVLGWPWKN